MTEFDLPQDPSPATQVIRGRRGSLLYPLMNLVFLGLIVWLSLSAEGSWAFALLLFFLVPILLQQVSLVVWPAQMTLEEGVLALRCGTTRLATPLGNLAQFVVHGGTLHVVLRDPQLVLPARQASALLQSFAQSGAHLRIPGAFFSVSQSNIVCRAAGLPEQESDALAERFLGFDRKLRALTPRIWCVPALLAANVAVFLALAIQSHAWFQPDSMTLIDWGANYGPRTLDGQSWRLLTSMFVHVGIPHLAFNVWALFVIGALIERLTGNLGFAVVYGLAGLGGSLASVIWHPAQVSAGASGAIFGLVGALLGLLLRSRDQMPHELWRHLRYNALYFVVINILFGFAVPMIDQAAHIGGLVSGFLVGLTVATPLAGHSQMLRWLRNVAIAALGVALIWQALRFLPPPPGDWVSAEHRVEITEKRLDKILETTIDCYNQGTLSSDRTVEALESVLRQWREARAQLDSLANLPQELADPRNRNCEVIKQKEQEVDRLIDAVRRHGVKPKGRPGLDDRPR